MEDVKPVPSSPLIAAAKSPAAPIRRPAEDRRWTAPEADVESNSKQISNFLYLALGATGVVFGDIGTSPLYTYSGMFSTQSILEGQPDANDIVGCFSMVFYTLTWIVCFKYVFMVMRVNHHGEGGVFALMMSLMQTFREEENATSKELPEPQAVANNTLATNDYGSTSSASTTTHANVKSSIDSYKAHRQALLILLGTIGCSLLIGDGAITPVISVLSALDGLSEEGLGDIFTQDVKVAIGCVILVMLFSVQRYGSHSIGNISGPIIFLWFLTLAGLGVYNIALHPEESWKVAGGFSPMSIVRFWTMGKNGGWNAWRSLAGVTLAVTGAEALYADMGHFGAGPISAAWFFLAYPSLVLQYFGQAVALLHEPQGIHNPFFHAVPHVLKLPMTVLATIAAILASQALISGVFTLLSQAQGLRMLPRLLVICTNPAQPGQIYIPEVNLLLGILCLLICVTFRSSHSLAGAYGIAVTGTFVVTTALFWMVVRYAWKWEFWTSLLLMLPVAFIDVLLYSSNLMKIANSGWVPIVIAVLFCLVMHSYRWGKQKEDEAVEEENFEILQQFLPSSSPGQSCNMDVLKSLLAFQSVQRTRSLGVFLTGGEDIVPQSLWNVWQSMQCLPSTIVMMSLKVQSDAPFVEANNRADFEVLDETLGLYRVVMRFGYAEPFTKQRVAIQSTLSRIAAENKDKHPALSALVHANAAAAGKVNMSEFEEMIEGRKQQRLQKVTFFINRDEYTVVRDSGYWTRLRGAIFIWLVRNARRPVSFFGLEDANTFEVAVMRIIH